MKFSKTDIAQLKRVIVAAKKAYYNSGKNLRLHADQLDDNVARLLVHGSVSRGEVVWPKGTERIPNARIELTDSVYDLCEFALKELEPNAAVLKQVRAPVPAGGRQVEVKLPYLMPSLDKKHLGEGTLQKWLDKYPGPYIIMDKLDGISMELMWEDGEFDKAYKGGSSTHGMDWSHAIQSLKLPKKTPAGDGGVRCELIMSKAEFEAKWGHKYKNARNLTSGIVNKTRGLHEAIGSVTPIVLDVLHKRMAPSKALAWAKQQGFTVVHHITATKVTEEKLDKYLKAREKSDHMIDGLVIAQDKAFPLGADNPKTMVAFKAPSAGNQATTTIREIEWRPSRHGKLIPRFTVDPVKLAGVTVTHATAHNASYVVSNLINVGSVISLTRSGEVIPYVTEVIKASKTASLPDRKLVGEYAWDTNRTHLMLVDAKANDTGQIKAIAHFFAKGLEVDGLGVGVAQQLYEAGYDTVAKVLRMKPSDYLAIDGWQAKKSQNVYQGIKDACNGADVVKVMAGSGMFGALIGTRKLDALRKARPKLFDFDHAYSTRELTDLLLGVPGYQDKTSAPIIANLSKFSAWVSKLPITFKQPDVVKVAGSKLKGEAVCFTGVRSLETETAIVAQGGTIASGVNGKTTILVVKAKGSGSSKDQKAQELGIPIYTLEQFRTKYWL